MMEGADSTNLQENITNSLHQQAQQLNNYIQKDILQGCSIQLPSSPNQSHFNDLKNQQQYVFKRNVSNQKEENENRSKLNNTQPQQKKLSSRSHYQSSQKNNSSQNSLDTNGLMSFDQKFVNKLLKHNDEYQTKWYKSLHIFFHFLGFQFFHPFVLIYSLFKKCKQKNNKVKKNIKYNSCLFMLFLRLYFVYSSIVLWIACVNYIYIKVKKPMNKEEYDNINSEYNKVFIYYIVISIGFAILSSSAIQNHFLFFQLFDQVKNYTKNSLQKFMRELFISDHDFMFQFIKFPNEDEIKTKSVSKIKKVFKMSGKKTLFFNGITVQYYSGLDFCEKIVHFSQKKNRITTSIFLINLFVTIIVYFKAFIPGIYRYYNGNNFAIYNNLFTIIPYLCIGNIIGLFSRTTNSLQDLNLIYDFNRALSALISYDSYLKLKPKYIINTPSINPIDIKSLKTWSQMRKLLNELKREESIPIDKCTLFLFIYLALVFLAVFIDKFFDTVILLSFSNQKYLVPYYSIDVLLISCLFCQRVYGQTRINEQYKEQYKLLQQLKNILMKFFVIRDNYVENDNIISVDKDEQWHFYTELNENYINTINSYNQFDIKTMEFIKGNTNRKDNSSDEDSDINHGKQIHNKNFDFQYSVQIYNLIEYIQNEIQMEILQTPMKFMGLLPSSYYLLWTFLSFTGTFIYLAFYLYLNVL